MRFGLYDPYLDVLGGGEKYVLTILEEAARTHEVTVLGPRRPEPERWRRLNVDVDPSRVRWRRCGPLSVTARTRELDVFLAITNHFPPLSLAGRSAVVVQFPQASVGRPPRAWERRARLRSYDSVLVYSEFVRDHVRRRLGIDATVLAPPVDVAGATVGPKEQLVVAVGRFFPAEDTNNKKHDLLIDAWRQLAPEGWVLHLAGGLHDDEGSRAHLEALRSRAAGLNVHFHPNITPDALEDLYARAAIFWHAAGHGETAPERQEHFGITTVEAMAHGCVPVVPALGGQLEIVRDGETGRLWRDLDELRATTRALMGDPDARAAIGGAARVDAARFDRARFVDRVRGEVLAP